MLARALALGVLEAGAHFEARLTARDVYCARLGADAHLYDDMQPCTCARSSGVAAPPHACIQCPSVELWLAVLARAQCASADAVHVRARLLDGRVQTMAWPELAQYLAECARRVPLPCAGMDGEALGALECARTELPPHSAEELAAAAYLCADATSRRAVLWTTSAGRKYKHRAAAMTQHVVHMRRALRALAATVCALAAATETTTLAELRAAARFFVHEYEARASTIVAEDAASRRPAAEARRAPQPAAEASPGKAPTLAAAVLTEFT